MTTLFEKSDEWGGYTIRLGSSGFILDYHTHVEGEIDGIQIVVPYGTWGFWAVMNLDAPYDEIATNGEALADMALKDAGKPVAERSVDVLDPGEVLDPSKRKKRTVGHTTSPEEGAPDRTTEETSSWYSFSLPKVDEESYGRCHDLFAEMYLTHGLPHGMALWTTSDFDTEENIFFAQIPRGLELEHDPFFRAFPLAHCPPPSQIGLSLLVGHVGEQPKPKPAPQRGRPWRRNEGATLKTAAA